MSVSVYNPDLDPEGREAGRIVAWIAMRSEDVPNDRSAHSTSGCPRGRRHIVRQIA